MSHQVLDVVEEPPTVIDVVGRSHDATSPITTRADTRTP